MAHAARKTLVSVETIVEEDFMASEASAAGTLSSLYVSAIAEVPKGSWPLGLGEDYAADDGHLAVYAAAALSEQGFRDYLDQYVLAHVL